MRFVYLAVALVLVLACAGCGEQDAVKTTDSAPPLYTQPVQQAASVQQDVTDPAVTKALADLGATVAALDARIASEQKQYNDTLSVAALNVSDLTVRIAALEAEVRSMHKAITWLLVAGVLLALLQAAVLYGLIRHIRSIRMVPKETVSAQPAPAAEPSPEPINGPRIFTAVLQRPKPVTVPPPGPAVVNLEDALGGENDKHEYSKHRHGFGEPSGVGIHRIPFQEDSPGDGLEDSRGPVSTEVHGPGGEAGGGGEDHPGDGGPGGSGRDLPTP